MGAVMTPEDFRCWLDYHSSLFAGFREWASDPEREEAMQVWYRELRRFDLDVVKRASAQLLVDPGRPKWFSDHLAALVEHCWAIESLRQREIAEGAPQRCELCGDTGRVLVRMRQGGAFTTPLGHRVTETYVACSCSRGERYRERECDCPNPKHPGKTHGLPVYDQATMERITRPASERFAYIYGELPAPPQPQRRFALQTPEPPKDPEPIVTIMTPLDEDEPGHQADEAELEHKPADDGPGPQKALPF